MVFKHPLGEALPGAEGVGPAPPAPCRVTRARRLGPKRGRATKADEISDDMLDDIKDGRVEVEEIDAWRLRGVGSPQTRS